MASTLIARSLTRGMFILCFLLPLAFFPGLISLYRLPKMACLAILTSSLCWLWFLDLVRRQSHRPQIFPLFLPLFFLLLVNAISLLEAANPYEGSVFLLQLIAGVTLFWLTANHIEREKIPLLFLYTVSAGTAVSLLGIAQVWGITIPTLIPTGGPGSTFGNKNMAAQFLLFTLPVAFYLLLSSAKSTHEWLYAVLTGLNATYFVYTGTRAAWGAAAVGFFTLWFCLRAKGNAPQELLHFTKRKWFFLLAIMAFVLAMNTIPRYLIPNFGAVPTLTRIHSMLAIEQDSSAQGRFAVWANSLAMFKDHPILGVGKGNFRFAYQLYARSVIRDPTFSVQSRAANAHNDYVEILAETGISGMVFFLLVLTLIARKLWLALGQRPDGLSSVIAFSLMAILAEAFWDFPFDLPTPTLFFWIHAGLLWRLAETNPEAEKARPSSVIIVGLLALLSTLFAITMTTSLRAEYYYSRGARATYDGRLDSAERDLTRATSISPFNYRYHFLRGLTMIRKKDYPEAIRSTLRSLSLNPYNINALNNLGVAYILSGNVDKAIHTFETSLKIWPDHIEAHDNLGAIYLRLGNSGKAREHFEEALKLNPKDQKALDGLRQLNVDPHEIKH